MPRRQFNHLVKTMNSIETRIIHEIGELSRVHAINVKAILEQRDTALQNAEMWKQRAMKAETELHQARATQREMNEPAI